MLSNFVKVSGHSYIHGLARNTVAARTTPTRTSAPRLLSVDEATRHAMIARAAYYVAEHRGFKGGSANEDWLAAEVEVDGKLGLHS